MTIDESEFPRLKELGYLPQSSPDERYNCIAWAAGENHRWWEPCDGRYWPEAAPQEYTVNALADAYATEGFTECENSLHEVGVQKIALYGSSDGEYLHAARQLKNGDWTSKLGPDDDIRHSSLEALAEGIYGNVVRIMSRPYPSGMVLGD